MKLNNKFFVLAIVIAICNYAFSQGEAYNQLQQAAGGSSVYVVPVNGPIAVGEESQPSQANNTNAQIIAGYQSKAYEFNNDGVSHHNSGNYQKAIKYYKKALWYDPYNETARNNLNNARKAKRLYNENKRVAKNEQRKQRRETQQILEQPKDVTDNNASERDRINNPTSNSGISDLINEKARLEAEKANADLEESREKLTELKTSLDNTNRLLMIYSKSLANNSGELDKWAEMVDKTYQNTMNVSKEYFLNMFLKYSLLTNLDSQYRNGAYKKLEELLKSNDPQLNSWLTKELALQGIKVTDVEKFVDLVLLGCDAETLGSNIFSGSPDKIKTNLDAVIFVNSVFEAADWANYENFKDAPMFKQMAGVKGLTKPGDWFSQAKVVGEVYSDLVVQCISWQNINELVSDNEEKSHKVDMLIL
jgi:tetratricopeptide (TPR) repeat protein